MKKRRQIYTDLISLGNEIHTQVLKQVSLSLRTIINCELSWRLDKQIGGQFKNNLYLELMETK